MRFFKKLLGFEPKLIKLISAIIITDEEHNYFTILTRHHSQLQLLDFVRLALHYYSKILVNFDPLNLEMAQSAAILMEMMDTVLAAGIKKGTNILYAANISDVVKIVSSKPRNNPRQIIATLFFVNVTQRHITTNIPQNVYAQHTVFSVMVLLQAILKEIDDECIDILNRSLKNMQSAYHSGQSFSDMRNFIAIPRSAYFSAIMEK